MKHQSLFAFLIACTVISACNSGNQKEITPDLINNPVTGAESDKEKQPEITFEEQRIDFGTISQGEIVRKQFSFKNTGNAPFVISTIYGECGCTVIEDWQKEPVNPGDEVSFTAVFNSEGKEGKQNIRVYVTGNTVPSKNPAVLVGNVVKPK
ncbi:MAG: DUF1573 domain-containing protein [Luteibaculum sp.]